MTKTKLPVLQQPPFPLSFIVCDSGRLRANLGIQRMYIIRIESRYTHTHTQRAVLSAKPLRSPLKSAAWKREEKRSGGGCCLRPTDREPWGESPSPTLFSLAPPCVFARRDIDMLLARSGAKGTPRFRAHASPCQRRTRAATALRRHASDARNSTQIEKRLYSYFPENRKLKLSTCSKHTWRNRQVEKISRKYKINFFFSYDILF